MTGPWMLYDNSWGLVGYYHGHDMVTLLKRMGSEWMLTLLWMVCENAWGLCGRQVHLLEEVLYMNAACQPCNYGYMTAATGLSYKISDASSMDAGHQAKPPNCMEIQCLKSWHSWGSQGSSRAFIGFSGKMSGASSMDVDQQANLPNCMEIRCITWWQLSECHVRC